MNKQNEIIAMLDDEINRLFDESIMLTMTSDNITPTIQQLELQDEMVRLKAARELIESA